MSSDSYEDEVQQIIVTVQPKQSADRRELRKIDVRIVLRNSIADTKSFTTEDPIALSTIFANISAVKNGLTGSD